MDLNEISSLFSYDPNSGIVTYASCGSIATKKDVYGYLNVRVLSKRIKAHRVAWLLFYKNEPPKYIDHKNGQRDDNRIVNLRAASISQNSMNRKINFRNKSGVKGVYWHKARNSWTAEVRSGKKRLFQKSFSCLEDAKSAVIAARNAIHGEFARHE